MNVRPFSQKVWLALLLMVGVMAWSPGPSNGQSYLEKLEALVEKAKREAAGPGELPAPKAKSPADAAVVPEPKPPGRSILEPATPPGAATAPGPATTPATDAGTAGPAPGPAGRVYLGLEAEKPPGGGLGVRVSKVTEGSPAWKAGFQVGDRILAIDRFGIADLQAMGERMQLTRPGQPCEFLITRNDRTLPLTAVLMDAELASRIYDSPPGGSSEGKPWLGADVSDLTPLFRDQFGIKVFAGAAITSVDRNSPAAKAGIKPGDCIVELGGAPIGSANDFKSTMARRRPGESVDLIVHRGAFPRNVRLTLEIDPADRGVGNGRSNTAPRASGTAPVGVPSPAPSEAPLALERLTPSGPLPVPSEDPEQQIAALEQEVAQLTEQLRAAQEQLRQSQLQLNQLADRLGKQP